MPFPIGIGSKRRAVVDRDPEPDKRHATTETADASSQTAIGLVAGPKLFIHDIREAPLYMPRREYELNAPTVDHGQSKRMQGFDVRS